MVGRVVLALAVWLTASATPASAQRGPMPPPRDVAELVGACMSRELLDWLTAAAWVEELEAGYRVVLPLRGDPIRHLNAQFPPPAEDTLAWMDLHRYDDASRAPVGLERWPRHEKFYARAFLVEFRPGDPVYAVRLGGYDWYTLGWMTVRCLDEATDG